MTFNGMLTNDLAFDMRIFINGPLRRLLEEGEVLSPAEYAEAADLLDRVGEWVFGPLEGSEVGDSEGEEWEGKGKGKKDKKSGGK